MPQVWWADSKRSLAYTWFSRISAPPPKNLSCLNQAMYRKRDSSIAPHSCFCNNRYKTNKPKKRSVGLHWILLAERRDFSEGYNRTTWQQTFWIIWCSDLHRLPSQFRWTASKPKVTITQKIDDLTFLRHLETTSLWDIFDKWRIISLMIVLFSNTLTELSINDRITYNIK